MKNYLTVKGLESLGVFVNVEHWRYAVPLDAKWGDKHKLIRKHRHEKWLDVKANGGITKLTISLDKPIGTTDKGAPVSGYLSTETECDKQDIYCKSRGIQICIGRILSHLYSKDERNHKSFEQLLAATIKDRVLGEIKTINYANK